MNTQADIVKALGRFANGMEQLEDALRENSVQRAMPPVVELAPIVKVDGQTPVVEVTVPVPDVNVTVPVPVVNVQQAAAPNVEIYAPPATPVGYVVRITRRDPQGFIEEFTITPASSQ